METSASAVYRFGQFEVNAASGELFKNGKHVKLQEQPFRLLVVLLENAGEVVSREDLRARIWPEDTFVDFDGSLRVDIRKLRDALGDDADSPRYIETIPKRGYRFLVTEVRRAGAAHGSPLEAVETREDPESLKTENLKANATPLAASQSNKAMPKYAITSKAGAAAAMVEAAVEVDTGRAKEAPQPARRSSGFKDLGRGTKIGIALCAILIIAAALLLWRSRPLTAPVVESVTQLTNDGVPKKQWATLATDGLRVYFNEGQTDSLQIAQVAATGGESAVIASNLLNLRLSGISPNGAMLTATSANYDEPTAAVWGIPLPAGLPRRIGDLFAQSAVPLRDGRLLFVRDAQMYVASEEGSDIRKLADFSDRFVELWSPTVSPDGSQIAFAGAEMIDNHRTSIAEVDADGRHLRILAESTPFNLVCCPSWTRDQRYLLYELRKLGRWDIWAVHTSEGLFSPHRVPVQVTDGPLSYTGAIPSATGDQLFALGVHERGELVRYDEGSKQFLPILPGISAFYPTYSADGQWIAYVTYPEMSLWRSRADGSERLQLTYPPVRATIPFISPDGSRVAYSTTEEESYVVNMDGTARKLIGEIETNAANWSPDANRLISTRWQKGHPYTLEVLDLRTGNRSAVPGSDGLLGGQWISPDQIVAAPVDNSKLVTFDFKTQKWSDLVVGTTVINWAHSLDFKYLLYTTGGPEPRLMRMRLADRHVEFITSLKNLRRALSPGGNTQVTAGPGGSAIFTRDIGSQEIYALRVRWP